MDDPERIALIKALGCLFDLIIKGIIIGTIALCVLMVVGAFVYQQLHP